MNEDNLNKVISNLEKKSQQSKIEALVYVALIIVIVITVSILFLNYSELKIDLTKAVIEGNITITHQNNSDLLGIIGNFMLRFGSVFLSIYLIKILTSLAKYKFKIVDHFNAIIDALILSNGELDKFKGYSNIFNSSQINFEKTSNTQYNKIIELLSFKKDDNL